MAIIPSIDEAPSYTFANPTIWMIDARMGDFAADLKSAAWDGIEGSTMQSLKLKHLFAHDTTPQPVFESLLSNHMQARIFLRPEAKAIWDHMFHCLTTRAPDSAAESEFNGRGFFRVTGNSSIGKSYSMIYLLKKFLDAGKLIFFDNRKEKKIYAFIPIVEQVDGAENQTVTYHTYITDVQNFSAETSSALLIAYPGKNMPPLLWDPVEDDTGNFAAGYIRFCRTCVAVSIKENLVKNAHKDFEVGDRYMAQYSLEQLETIRKLAYSDTSRKLLIYRYHRYGGLFRYAFANADRLAQFDD
jgi:hypothetical protein